MNARNRNRRASTGNTTDREPDEIVQHSEITILVPFLTGHPMACLPCTRGGNQMVYLNSKELCKHIAKEHLGLVVKLQCRECDKTYAGMDETSTIRPTARSDQQNSQTNYPNFNAKPAKFPSRQRRAGPNTSAHNTRRSEILKETWRQIAPRGNRARPERSGQKKRSHGYNS